MAKVRIGSARLNLAQLQAVVANVITKMTGNASFTTPNPSLANLHTLLTDSQTKAASYVAAKTAADQALVERDLAKKALADALDLEGAYVQNQSGGDEVQILSAGFEVRAAGAPLGPVGQVQNLSITEGDGEGMLDFQWDSENGARTYDLATFIGADFVRPIGIASAVITGLHGLPSLFQKPFHVAEAVTRPVAHEIRKVRRVRVIAFAKPVIDQHINECLGRNSDFKFVFRIVAIVIPRHDVLAADEVFRQRQ